MLHCTPTNYINNIRLDYARKLLDDPNQSILDVCYTVGYNSISYFYNLFKARFGVAPNRYRKMRMVVYPDVPPEQSPQAQETPDL